MTDARPDRASRDGTLEDRQQIADLVARYCRCIDRRELDGLRDLYTSDGVDHHTGFDGAITEFVPWVASMLTAVDGTMHLIGNHLAELHGDVAVAETYATAYHWTAPGDDPARNYVSILRYVDHLVRVPGGWRIRERWAVRERAFSLAGLVVERSAPGPSGSVGPDDPLLVLRGRLRAGGLEGPTPPDRAVRS